MDLPNISNVGNEQSARSPLRSPLLNAFVAGTNGAAGCCCWRCWYLSKLLQSWEYDTGIAGSHAGGSGNAGTGRFLAGGGTVSSPVQSPARIGK